MGVLQCSRNTLAKQQEEGSVCEESVFTLNTTLLNTTLLITTLLFFSPATEGEDDSGHISSFLRFKILTFFMKFLEATLKPPNSSSKHPARPLVAPPTSALQDVPIQISDHHHTEGPWWSCRTSTDTRRRWKNQKEESVLSPSICPPLSHRFLSGPPAADPAGVSVQEIGEYVRRKQKMSKIH